LALTACKGDGPAETNAAGNSVANIAETRASAPLTKDQALALMHERHEHMEALGDAAKNAGRELKSENPQLSTVQASAKQMTDLAPKLLAWFPAGTGPDVGKTRAKPEIWQKQEDFALKAKDFEDAATDFAAASQSGDLPRINATFGAVGKSCKACHDLYRAPEKD
jgi:cytochrome c556